MSKKIYLDNIYKILSVGNTSSVQVYANDIVIQREILNDILTSEENYELTSNIKNRIQYEANISFAGCKRGIVVGATGVGKTKIAVDKMNSILKANPDPKFVVVVPTQKLRDIGWKEEVLKWAGEELWSKIKPICYDSLHTIKNEKIDAAIFDECHNFTESSIQFLTDNNVARTMSLTATYPSNMIRAKLIHKYLGEVKYRIDTDTAVKLGIVSPYRLIIVNIPLDRVNKYVKAGSKDKPFFTTEYGNYSYLNTVCENRPSKFSYLKRMRFIYNLRSKMLATRWLLDNIIPNDIRTLIFAGSKDQADGLCFYTYYSKPTKKGKTTVQYEKKLAAYQGKNSLNLFLEEKINRLACVEALNEGENIPNVDCGLAQQITSDELDLVQRIGRCIRYRVGHTGTIIIVCSNETVDKQWVRKATANLTMDIKEIDLKDLTEGKEVITF